MSTLPAEPVRQIVQQYLDQYDVGAVSVGSNGNGQHRMSPLVRLAEEVGLGERWLRYFLSGEPQTIAFDRADRLLCVMGRVWEWYTEPLADYYWTIDLSNGEPAPKPKPVITLGEKFPCGHERTLENCALTRREGDKSWWKCRQCHNAFRREQRAAA